MPSCCAVNCTSSAVKGRRLFSVPCGEQNIERRKEWLHRIGRKGLEARAWRLCEDHFTDDQFEQMILKKTGVKKLKPYAVPSIFSHRIFPKKRGPPRDRSKKAVSGAREGGAEEDVDDEHDQQQDGQADAQADEPREAPLGALSDR
uniref:Putative apoptosis associated protein n=1 Tax=Ixodes ricinus TaxID=34613 RepID=A0A0K8RA75_IXORI